MGFEFTAIEELVGGLIESVAAAPVSSTVLDNGSEFLSDTLSTDFVPQLQGQVGDLAGNKNWWDLNNPSTVVNNAPTVTDFNLENTTAIAYPSATFANPATDFITNNTTAIAYPSAVFANPVQPGLLDQFQSYLKTTLSPENINKVATGLATDFAKQAVPQLVNQAISAVVPPALQPYAANGVNLLIANTSATPVRPGVDLTPVPASANESSSYYTAAPVDPKTDDPGALTADGYFADPQGNIYKIIDGGNAPAQLYRAAEVSADIDPEVGKPTYTTDANGNTYKIQANGDTQLVRAAEVPADIEVGTDPGLAQVPANANISLASIVRSAAEVAGNTLSGFFTNTVNSAINPALSNSENVISAALLTQANFENTLLAQARNQQTARQQNQNQAQSSDWRVRLSLAPNSDYLYNARDTGSVLWPLYNTNGVVFPYTPTIDTAYKANYSTYDLTHSNYRGYFYQNSYVDQITIKATFTAQDTPEANYLLAVIHFFRSVTKMFYGQDGQRGSPPPLTFLSGLGDYQFNKHPCVVSQFNYTLPADVNYIRAQNVSNNGTNQLVARNRQTVLSNPVTNALQRLASLGQQINPGALPSPFAVQGSLAAENPTYVPTKMDISLTLLPIQSRSQVSQIFSLKGFANGNQLKGGFW